MSQSEDLITSLIPKQLGVTTLTRLFQDLLREKVSIRNVGSILQAISENCASDGNLDYPLGELRYSGLLASVRRTLRHQISRSLPQADGEISAWELAPEIDRILSQSLVSGSPLSPQFVESVLNSFEGFESEEESPIILCSPRARSLLSQLLRRSERGAWVLSPEEISEELRVSIRGEFLSHALGEEPLRRAA